MVGTGVLAAQVHRVCNKETHALTLPGASICSEFVLANACVLERYFQLQRVVGSLLQQESCQGCSSRCNARLRAAPHTQQKLPKHFLVFAPNTKGKAVAVLSAPLPTFCLLHRKLTAEFRPASAADLQGRLTCPVPQPPCCSQPWIHTVSRGACSRRSSLLHQVLTQLQHHGTGSR